MSRPRRADARRNYDALLAAAKALLAERGPDVPLDDVAKHAGLGNATLYRHFPTRRELIVAVYADEVDELCRYAGELAGHADPGAALFDWLRAFVAHVAGLPDFALALPESGPDGDREALFTRWHDAVRAAAGDLLDRAQRAGGVRADLTVAELITLCTGISLSGVPPARVDRLLELVRTGLHAR